MVRPFANAPDSSKQMRFGASSELAQTENHFSLGPDLGKFSSGWTGGQNRSLVTSGSMPAVGRQAHNLKVTGSNPIPATTFVITHSPSRSNRRDGSSFFRGTRKVRQRGAPPGPSKMTAGNRRLIFLLRIQG